MIAGLSLAVVQQLWAGPGRLLAPDAGWVQADLGAVVLEPRATA